MFHVASGKLCFAASILELQSQIHYHQEQQELAEQELDRLKMTQAFAEDAAEKVEDALEHIEPKYVDVFREHLLSLFPTEAPVYLEEKPEPTVKEDTPKTRASFSERRERAKLLGIPDFTPDTFEDLAPNIIYSSSGRAYVGFHDRQQAEDFRESLEMPSLLDEAQIMNNHKWELKFYCDRSYLEELLHQLHNDDFEQDEDWTPEQKAELDWQEQLVRIAPDIFYDPSSSKCYMGFSNRGRATTYGAHLKEIYELYNSRYTVDKPVVCTNCKHELVIECITEENARKLADLNLKKDLEHRNNRDITDKWTHSNNSQDNDFVEDEELDFPTPPYKPIPLDQVELCDLVSTGEYVKAYYEITDHKGTHLLARCLYHDSLKHREGEEDFWITTPYLVEKG